MARIALARHAAQSFQGLYGFSSAFQTAAPRSTKVDGGLKSTQSDHRNLTFSLEAYSAEPALWGNVCGKPRAPHRGTPLGPFVCEA
jgi:hypothetical protein